MQPKLRRITAFNWKWLSILRPSEVLCGCREDGSLNVALPGRHAFAGRPKTTSGWHLHWPPRTYLPFAILMLAALVKIFTQS
jgi:hypothetical protein